MKHYFTLILLVCTTMVYSQSIQFDVGITKGSGVMTFIPANNSISAGKDFDVFINDNPRITTTDFYLSVVSKIYGPLYLRSKLETINFKGEIDIDYEAQCFTCSSVDTLNFEGEVNRKQIAFDILAEYRIIEKENWNIYYNAGISLIKILPTSKPYIGRRYGKVTAVTNLGGTYWMKPHLGFHGSIGYRMPSYGDKTYGFLPKVSINRYFLSLGVSLNLQNKSS